MAGALALAPALMAQSALAADEGPVPVEKASFHLPIFHNDYVLLLDVYIPPNRGGPMYHTHSLDQVSVLLSDTDMTNQAFGGEVTPPRRGTPGNVGFTANSKKPVTHRGFNVGTTPFHNIVMAMLKNQPYGFTAGTRTDAPAYRQVLDNERVRAWKIALEPGQAVPAITQSAPGMRIVIWQDAGVTRAIRNTGTTRVEFVEIELK
jgi:hypothetical protein